MTANYSVPMPGQGRGLDRRIGGPAQRGAQPERTRAAVPSRGPSPGRPRRGDVGERQGVAFDLLARAALLNGAAIAVPFVDRTPAVSAARGRFAS
jgi:hypothetical protein